MKQQFITSVLSTLVLTVLLGIAYPLVVTGIAQVLFHEKANGQLLVVNGRVIGARIIGQPFRSAKYFHSRPSAAGNGYDAASSGGSNLGPTNAQLVARVNDSVKPLWNGVAVPVDLVTASASGLDPDITPAAAYFQVERIARERNLSESQVRRLVDAHVMPRQLGMLGEARVNVMELNLALDGMSR